MLENTSAVTHAVHYAIILEVFTVLWLCDIVGGSATYDMKSTKVQTLGGIPGCAVRACANETIAHVLIKCTCNGDIRNIARQKTETITCNGTYTKNC